MMCGENNNSGAKRTAACCRAVQLLFSSSNMESSDAARYCSMYRYQLCIPTDRLSLLKNFRVFSLPAAGFFPALEVDTLRSSIAELILYQNNLIKHRLTRHLLLIAVMHTC